MVRSEPAPDAGEAPWLRHLRQALTFGRGKRLVLLRSAGPEHLGPVADMLGSIGETHICLRAAELQAVPHGSTALLVLRRRELSQLNQIRPFFSERALRMVLLADDETTIAAFEDAPDLLDWVSEAIAADPVVPRFVLESIERIAPTYPGFTWRGDDELLARAFDAARLDLVRRSAGSPDDYDTLVDTLQGAPGWRQVPIRHLDDALRLRLALAESGRYGRIVALGRPVPGWPVIDPSSVTWDELDAADPPISGAEAARLQCERAALSRKVIRPSIGALMGATDLPALRATLDSDQRSQLWQDLADDARQALMSGQSGAYALVAAWADRTQDVGPLETISPILATTALPAVLRSATPAAAHARWASEMGWFDIARRWGRPDAGSEPVTSRDTTPRPGTDGQWLATQLYDEGIRLIHDEREWSGSDSGFRHSRLQRALASRFGTDAGREFRARVDREPDSVERIWAAARAYRIFLVGPDAAYLGVGLTYVHQTVGRHRIERALRCVSQLLEESRQISPEGCEVQPLLLEQSARIAWLRGDVDGTERRLRQAIGQPLEALDPQDIRPDIGLALAGCWVQQGRPDEADRLLESIAPRFDDFGARLDGQAFLHAMRGRIRLADGRTIAAQHHLSKAVDTLRGIVETNHPDLRAMERDLARARRRSG